MPSKQTAAGAVDILSHVMEQYFQPNDEAYITDVLSEAVMKTVIKYARKAMDELCIIGHDGTPRLARFAREVFGVEEADNRKAAELGIQKVRAFNQSLEMPATLSEAGVPEDLFDEMASEAVRTSTIASKAYVRLESSDVKQILLNCK